MLLVCSNLIYRPLSVLFIAMYTCEVNTNIKKYFTVFEGFTSNAERRMLIEQQTQFNRMTVITVFSPLLACSNYIRSLAVCP